MCENHGFIKMSFADSLKRGCQQLFLFTDEQIYGTQEQKETPDPRWFGVTPRKILQYVGTDLLRDQLDKAIPGLGKNIFTHYVRLWYLEQLAANPNIKVVISDVRFGNEVALIQELGGMVIKIDRPSVIQSGDMHPSEVELQSITTYNKLISNDREGDINYVYSQLMACL